MSTHRAIDRICCAVLVLVLAATLLFCNAERLGIRRASTVMGYENRLFDTSRVHTIEIIMDGWEDFLEGCEDEEYHSCAVVIDNEAYKNVALRAKGNTSLSMVSAYGNDRYSFKIEFDHYESGTTYHGLDKLCLNNIIQDNTYMKDYLAYTLMRGQGVPAPLCSYVDITVNGEDWGLYLAVEAVEDAFLTRNYGKDAGNLYKPDGVGGGPGGGDGGRPGGFNPGNFNPEDFNPEDLPEGFPDMGELPEPPQGDAPGGGTTQPPQGVPDGGPNQPAPDDDSAPAGNPTPSEAQPAETNGDTPAREHGHGGGPGGMGSDDTKLKYIDDDPDSYSNIFDSAKTDITDADKARLIASLKKLSANEDIENVVDTDEVIRYLAVHDFLCNGDSYTGSMVHNYYLYEKDGQLAMLPWDYNLSFGGFGGMGGNGGSAAGTVNSPIDSPVNGELDDRPMVAWIFADEEYTARYHQYYAEFLDAALADGGIADIIAAVSELISPYVEKDPTKFCTFEEFQTGVRTLERFCALRLESIRGQLDGSIPSTAEGQEGSTALIDASDLNLSDMGSMNHGGGFGNRGGAPARDTPPDGGPSPDGGNPDGNTSPGGGNPDRGAPPEGDGDPGGDASPGGNAPPSGGAPDDINGAPNGSNAPGGNPAAPPFDRSATPDTSSSQNGVLLLALSAAVLLAGLLFALKFRR